MKPLTIAITTVFIYGFSFAQGTSYHAPVPAVDDPPAPTEVSEAQRPELGDLKGPRAKNFPKYKYQASKAVIEAPRMNRETLVGPEAKNYQPWENDTRTPHVVVTKKERANLSGPRAKNQKPWDN